MGPVSPEEARAYDEAYERTAGLKEHRAWLGERLRAFFLARQPADAFETFILESSNLSTAEVALFRQHLRATRQ